MHTPLTVIALLLLLPLSDVEAQDSSARQRTTAASRLAAPVQRTTATAATAATAALSGLASVAGAAAQADSLRKVPLVVGQTVKVATEVLARSGLRANTVQTTSVAASQPGQVIRQVPKAGTSVRVGSTVALYLDATKIDVTGVVPSRTDTAKPKPVAPDDVFAIVPDMVGSPALAAQAALKQQGLTGYYLPPIPRNAERAIVIAQTHKPLSHVDPMTRVGLTVAIDTMTTVPTLLKMTSGEVSQALKEASLRLIEQRAPDATMPVGLATRQQPEGGARVPYETPVVVTYSTGPRLVTVPDLGKHTREEAERLIAEARLRPGAVDTVSSRANVGLVVWQDPPAEASAPVGSAVQFHIGRSDPNAAVVVPGVIGLTLDGASQVLKPARLALHFVDSLPDSALASTIIRQDPASGTRVQPGSDVHVWTARPLAPPPPDSIVIPDVLGLTRDAATARLQQAKLNVGRQLAAQQGTPGRVSQQDPVAGSRDTVGAPVTLFIFPDGSVTSTIVPAVTRLRADAALEALEQAGLRGRLTDRRAASEPIHWVVGSQAPEAGARVPVNSAVRLSVQHVPDSVIVPNVRSHGADSARVIVGIGGLQFVVVRRPLALTFRETVLAQTPPGGSRVLRGANVNVDLSRPLGWPLTLATLPLLGYAFRKTPLWGDRKPKPPTPPVSFAVGGNPTETPLPEITPDTGLAALEITLEFGVDKVDSYVDGIRGSIVLSEETSHA